VIRRAGDAREGLSAGTVFARYSEPMADDRIYDMVGMAWRYLPRAGIDIVTNGDYVKPDGLARLRAAGPSVLRVSIYMQGGVPWGVEAACEEIARLGRRIQIDLVWGSATATTVDAQVA